MAEFRVGDQIEVRFTGTVICVAPSILTVEDKTGRYIYVRPDEQITLIEPAYEPGRAYRTSAGIYLLRGMDDKWRNCYGDIVMLSKDDRLELVG